MAIRKVARLGHPVLRSPCREVSETEIRSPAMRQLIADMHETMTEYGGVGLAAPQVHEPIRVAVIDIELPTGEADLCQRHVFDLFNPRVTVEDPVLLGNWEGCLSVPDMRGYVERPRGVRVDYLDQDAAAHSIVVEGFLSTVFQHELDHLDGVLYVDKIADPAKFSFMQEYTRYHLDDDLVY